MRKKTFLDRKKERREKLLAEEHRKLSAEEEIDAAVAQSSVKGKKNLRRKNRIRLAIGGGVFFLLILLGYYLFTPFKGSMAYGVCKIFLERNVQYPTMLRLSQVEEFSNWVRIWYTQIDSFGAERMQPIQCYFRPDEVLGYMVLDKITVDRREVDPQVVQAYNKMIPLILANPPDLTLPDPLPDNLQNLRFDVNRYVKPIL